MLGKRRAFFSWLQLFAFGLAFCELAGADEIRISSENSQHPSFISWAKQKSSQVRGVDEAAAPEYWRFEMPSYIPYVPQQVRPVGDGPAKRIADATQLYFKIFGKDRIDSLLWTGVESGNPLTRHEEYRWNSLREEGLYDPARRKALLGKLKALGIRNVRLGLSNHEIDVDRPESWKDADDLVGDFSRAGIRISLDLHHFGAEDRFRVLGPDGKTDGSHSYYLNPEWPDYFARFAKRAVEKYRDQISAVTIMNEPETVVGFNGEMWHGGFPGWSDAQSNRWYLERCLQVATASVKARIAIEKFFAEHPQGARPNLLYIHTEASVHKGYWADFNLYRRFIISDLILGHEWLMEAKLKALASAPLRKLEGRWQGMPASSRTNFDWVVENYVIYNQPPQDRAKRRDDLVLKLGKLRGLHRQLAKLGKTMRSDTVFAIDYYSHNEDKGSDNQPLDPQPQHYAEQVISGKRGGIYTVMMDYFNHYQMPMMVGESGTPYFYYGAKWNQQMLIECAKAAASGVPFLGYTIYPAIDTWGWESALSVPRDKAILNPSGIVTLDIQDRPFMKVLLQSLHEKMH